MEQTNSKRTQTIVTILLVVLLLIIISVYIYVGMYYATPVSTSTETPVETITEIPNAPSEDISSSDVDPNLYENQLRAESPSNLTSDEEAEIIEALLQGTVEVSEPVPGDTFTDAERQAVINSLQTP